MSYHCYKCNAEICVVCFAWPLKEGTTRDSGGHHPACCFNESKRNLLKEFSPSPIVETNSVKMSEGENIGYGE